MILLLGANNFIGQAFCAELRRRAEDFLPLAMEEKNFADLHVTYDVLRRLKPKFVIFVSGDVRREGDGGFDEQQKGAILYENVLVPQTVAQACRMRNVPWAKVSSGSVFQGAKVFRNRSWDTEIDLARPDIRRLIRAGGSRIQGFSEVDQPNHCFTCPPCDFFSGAAALGEQAIRDVGAGYILRHGLMIKSPTAESPAAGPERHSGRNGTVHHCLVSVTSLSEYASAALQLWFRQAPFGIYHIANPGPVDLEEISGFLYSPVRSRYILDNSKFEAFGIKLTLAADLLAAASPARTEPHPGRQLVTGSPKLSVSATERKLKYA